MPTEEELADLRRQVAETIARGDLAPNKGLLRTLVKEVRVTSRDDASRWKSGPGNHQGAR